MVTPLITSRKLTCVNCWGIGKRTVFKHNAQGGWDPEYEIECELCHGTGHVDEPIIEVSKDDDEAKDGKDK